MVERDLALLLERPTISSFIDFQIRKKKESKEMCTLLEVFGYIERQDSSEVLPAYWLGTIGASSHAPNLLPSILMAFVGRKFGFSLFVGAILLGIVLVPNYLLERKINNYRGKFLSVYGVASVEGPFFLDGHSGVTLYLNDGGHLALFGVDDALFEEKDIKLVRIGDYSITCRGGPFHDDVLMRIVNIGLPPPQISNINHLVRRYKEVEKYVVSKVPLSSEDGVFFVPIERDSGTYQYSCLRYSLTQRFRSG